MRRQNVWLRSLLAVGLFLAALVGPAPALDGVFGAACAGASGPTVALVVDFGDVTTAGPRPGGVEVHCVPHTSRFTGVDALRAAGYELRFAPSGLLCAVNDYPTDGCGERSGAGRRFRYWAYWRADGGGWDYAGIGPASSRPQPGSVDGWRFVEGSASPNDPPPRWAPDHAAICGVDDGGGPPAPGGGGIAAVAPPLPDVPAPGPDAAAPDTPGPTGGDSTSTTATAAPGPDQPSAPASAGSQGTAVARVDEQAIARADEEDEGNGIGRTVGFVAVAAVAVGLGALAVRRSRRAA